MQDSLENFPFVDIHNNSISDHDNNQLQDDHEDVVEDFVESVVEEVEEYELNDDIIDENEIDAADQIFAKDLHLINATTISGKHSNHRNNLNIADLVVVYGLRAGGVNLSDKGFDLLLRILNSQCFKNYFISDCLSKNYIKHLKKVEDEKFASQWTKVSLLNSVCWIRKIEDMINELKKDVAFFESFEQYDYDDLIKKENFVWAKSWCNFPLFIKRSTKELTCRIFSFGLWLDAGEIQSQQRANSIYLLVLFPLNSSRSFARRKDCLYPIGFVNTTGGSDIIDCLRLLLPSILKLAEPFDVVVNGYAYKGIISIDLIVGDSPAIRKALMLHETANSKYPCTACLIKSSKKDKLFLGDVNRWIECSEKRTQKKMEAVLAQMVNENEVVVNFGMRDEGKIKSNPLFEVFKHFKLDVFDHVGLDMMHCILLGGVKSICKCMARLVLKNKLVEKFKAIVSNLHQRRIRGLDLTLWKLGDSKAACTTDLLHLLQKGSLHAREYHCFLPLIPIVFSSLDNHDIDRVIPSLTDLVCYLSFLLNGWYPVQGPIQTWWEDLRLFGLQRFKVFQSIIENLWGNYRDSDSYPNPIAKKKNLLVLHELFCHATERLKNQGSWCGVHGLEAIFGHFKRMTSNRKDSGPQLLKKLLGYVDAGIFVSQDNAVADELTNIIEKNPNKEYTAGFANIEDGIKIFVEGHLGSSDTWKAVTWIVSSEDRGGKNVPKIWGSKSYYRLRNDAEMIVEIDDANYFKIENIINQNSQFYFVGYLVDNLNLLLFTDNYRMPVLRLRYDAEIQIRQFDLCSVKPIVVIEHIKQIPDEVRNRFQPPISVTNFIFSCEVIITFSLFSNYI